MLCTNEAQSGRRKRAVALIVDKFDSLRESDEEKNYVPQIRLQLERIGGRRRKFPVYLTATDVDFVSRVVGPPRRDTALQLIPLEGWPSLKMKCEWAGQLIGCIAGIW